MHGIPAGRTNGPDINHGPHSSDVEHGLQTVPYEVVTRK
jgi:hypothetical protein